MRIIFFIIVTLFSLLMASYVALRGWQALQLLQHSSPFRHWYIGANIFLFITMMAGFMGRGNVSPELIKIITFVGFSYFIAIIYFLISFLLVDLVRLSNLVFHFAPVGLKVFRFWAFMASASVILLSMIYGNYKFNHPSVVTMDLQSDKILEHKTMKIVAVSDIHLGTAINKKNLQKYVKMINDQKPDIVLMAGDVADNLTQPLIDQNMGEELSQIVAPLGVYAIAGNHEYYGESPEATENYLKKAGIVYLRDTSVLINNSFYLVGRDDRTNPKRKQLGEITQDVDKSKTMILLDHQPYHLEEAQENKVDLQISGHTHNGQFFPGNLFVKRMYEVGYGYRKIGNTHYYVSSGLGLWGPQYRIGTQSELVVINLSF